MNKWAHLSFASSLCAACSSVCPVHIDIHELLLENRWEAYQKGKAGFNWKIGLKLWAWVMSGRVRLNIISSFGRLIYRLFLPFLPSGKRKRVPKIPSRSFEKLWKDYEQQN
jgi:L-lactate dehydrogenase complex protein LldF